jgi:aerobic carbon-monoxide dehydrogenase medium subunit
MKPAPFDYHAPRSIKEAATLLATLDNAKVIAGGQSLVPMMNFRYVIVDHIVDLAKVEGLAGIKVNDATLRIGAMTRQRDLEFSTEIAQHCPLLQEALSHVGHRQTRNRGTIGGSLAHADPAAEQPTVCAAHDAVVEITSTRGTRRVPFAEFPVAFMTTAVEPDEIVTAIEISLWPAGHGYSFQEYARRRGDFAIVGAAALLDLAADRTVRRASLTLCGVGIGPLRMSEAEHMLAGQRFDRGTAQAAAATAKTITPVSDIHASSDYRRHLAEVLAFRALRDAAARCGTRI